MGCNNRCFIALCGGADWFTNNQCRYQNYQGGKGLDIWSLTMKSGGRFTYPGGGSGPAVPQAYSGVNRYLDATQWSPSLAARHLFQKYQTAHLFADEQQQQVSFHFTDVQAGQPGLGLRPAPGGAPASPAPANKAATGLLHAYPNPADSNGATAIELSLRPGETLRQVLDLAGRPVADLTPGADEGPNAGQLLTWKPGGAAAGTYVVRATTSQRSETTAITRK